MKMLNLVLAFFILLTCNITGASGNTPLAWEAPKGSSGTARIVGGTKALPDAWPWMTAIISADVVEPYYGIFCGATLISPSWVLTAAHCVLDEDGSLNPNIEVDVIIGLHDLTKDQGERIHVSRIILNADYDPILTDGDIALLELETPSTKTPVSLIGQSFGNPLVVSGTATALGWGAVNTDGSGGTDELMQVALPVVDNSECSRAEAVNGYGNTITDNMVCAGAIEGFRDSCFGDSGGPLVIPNGTGWHQMGIVSFGPYDGCGIPGAYGIYTRVSRYGDWITENICKQSEKPVPPVVKVDVDGNSVSLFFDPVEGATGYRLYYAPYPGKTPVHMLDMGKDTELIATQESGSAFYLAVRSYNGVCAGDFSNLTFFQIPLAPLEPRP